MRILFLQIVSFVAQAIEEGGMQREPEMMSKAGRSHMALIPHAVLHNQDLVLQSYPR